MPNSGVERAKQELVGGSEDDQISAGSQVLSGAGEFFPVSSNVFKHVDIEDGVEPGRSIARIYRSCEHAAPRGQVAVCSPLGNSASERCVRLNARPLADRTGPQIGYVGA